MKTLRNTIWTAVGLFGLAALVAMPSAADQVILDDLIVDGSICAGFDCVNGESFGFDTLRLKENNLRIKFQDTSTSASFPSADWQITANDTSNGGQNKFSIDNITDPGGRTPFTIEAGARSHALYVDDGGRIGIGTNTPVVDLHVKTGNTPTLRLEQDGSSGFTAQTWDVAGNEANFFVRDASNGSTLPFRIEPGAASNMIYIDGTDRVGIGNTSPDSKLHVKASDAKLQVTNNGTTAVRQMFVTENNGTLTWIATDTSVSNGFMVFNFVPASNQINLTSGQSTNNFDFNFTSGNLDIDGEIISNSCPGGCGPDYVFEPDYKLMTLDEVEAFIQENKHLPNIPSAADNAGGIRVVSMQLKMLEKIEELTLHTIDQHKTIEALQARLDALEAKSAE